MLPSRVALFLALVLTPISGCYLGQNAAASAAYARQVATAMLRVSQLEALLSDADMRIEQLEEVIRQQGQNEANRLENIDQVNQEVSRLRGEIEVATYELQRIRLQLETYQISQERRQLHDEARLKQIEAFLRIAPPPPPTDAELGITVIEDPEECDPAGGDPCPPADDDDDDGDNVEENGGLDEPVLPEDAKGKLEEAMKEMEEGRQAVARVILERALQEHPTAEEVPEIHYRIAETHFNEENFRKAAQSYRVVTESYGESSFAPWAMFYVGKCFDGLKQPENGRLFYEGTVQKFPRSDAAREAKKLLGNK